MSPVINEVRPLLRLALPLIAVNLGNMLMGVVDTIVAGRVDAMTQAGVGLGLAVIHLGHIMGLGVVLGIDPIVSQAVGAGERRLARRAMWQGVHMALLVALPLAGLSYAAGQGLEWAGVEPELAREARSYVHPRLLSLLPFHVFLAMRSYLQAFHLTWPMVLSTVVANIFNALADWILVFGDAGLADLGLPAIGLAPGGVAGLAWATTVGTFIQMGILAAGVMQVEPGPGDEPLRRPDRALLAKGLGLGIPISFFILAEGGVFNAVAVLMARMGKVPTASNQVALMLAAFTFMIPLGISMAATVRVGHAIGRGETPAARRAGFGALGVTALLMSAVGVAMILGAEPLARVLAKDAEVIALSTTLLRIAGVFQIFDGTQVVASAILRGAGDTRWPSVLGVVGYWVLGLPAGLWLTHKAAMGPPGLWWGLTIGLGLVAIALSVRFARLTRVDVIRV